MIEKEFHHGESVSSNDTMLYMRARLYFIYLEE